MGTEKPKQIEPYKGLRPYEEENRDIFFGRDQERKIIIDKVYSNKLTLLFAATGVGKSSLLQAAVMPELKRPERLNLDVVYYTDWVSNPLEGLKQKTIQVLQERGKVGFDYQIDENVTLKDFFQLCSTFASEPLVVVLDQFEEFFQYRRYQEDYLPFVKEFSHCVMDRATPTAFIISMREDFALELNVFKDYLPTTLFENYFRLEKLNEEKARQAICKPVERIGFFYENELLNTLLKDLTDREKEAGSGAAPSRLMKDMPTYVEPPYLQIVCTQLWEADKHDPEQKIRMESYEKMGRATGFVDSYFHEVMNRFSSSQKKIASLAFNLLVTPRGTKMAYTVRDLGDRIRVTEKELEQVLEKLQKSRILRSQKREGVVWYELYHDIFSNIINHWNDKFKTRQRIKRASILSVIAIFTLLILFLIYYFISNTTSHYLRLSVKETTSNHIEVYRGNLKIPDIFNLHAYQAEAVYRRSQVEPDKLFVEKQIGDFDLLNQELIGHLPLINRISEYWNIGEISKAFDSIENSISKDYKTRSRQVIDLLSELGSIKSYEILKEHLNELESIYIRKEIIAALASMPTSLVIEDIKSLLKDKVAEVRRMAVTILGQIGGEKEVEPLIELLKDPDDDVRRSTAYALGELGSEKAIEPLIELLKNPYHDDWSRAADALVRLGSEKAVEPLFGLLKDPNSDVRSRAADALVRFGSEKLFVPLIDLLNDPDLAIQIRLTETLIIRELNETDESLTSLTFEPDTDVRGIVSDDLVKLYSEQVVEPFIDLLHCSSLDWGPECDAVGRIDSERVVESLIDLLKYSNSKVQSRAAEALIRLGSEKAVDHLIGMIKDPRSDVREYAAKALGGLGSEKAVEPLIGLLSDPDFFVRITASEALGRLGSEKVVEPLIGLLKDPNHNIRSRAVEALGRLGSEKAVEPLIGLLKDSESSVRSSVSEALGSLGSEKAVESLIVLFKDLDSDARLRAAYALGRLGSAKAIEPLVTLVNDVYPDVRKSAVVSLGKLSARDKSGVIKNLYTKKNEKPIVRLAAAATLLEWGDNTGLEYIKEVSKQDNLNRRIEVAEVLGDAPSKQGTLILMEMLNDETISVKEKVILSLGKAKAVSSLPYLHKLIQEPNTRIRAAVVDALSKIASPASSETLKKVAVKTGELMPTRVKAINALAKISHKDAIQALMEFLNNENSIVQYKTIMAIGKNPPSQDIPADLLNQLKSRLNDKLEGLEKQKAKWRKIRDEETEDYNQEQTDEWRSRLKKVEPNEPLEFELAFALSRIDPGNEGVELLGHHLANVREGAWMGLGKSGKVSLIEELYWKRKDSDLPWFIHAAYRAIDHILINIDAFGGEKELKQLEALYKNLSEKEGKDFHEGVQTRMEWTIERLRERVISH
jgi:HEAT repeat protein